MRIFLLLIISIFCMMGCNPKTQNSIEPKADSVVSSTESSHPTESDNSSESINQFLSLESESSKKAMEIVIHYAQESIDHKKDLGFIVSVITKDGVSVRSLGDLADLPSPLSAYSEIGSLSKVFTGMALASMVNEGIVTLDTPLSACLPEGMLIDGLDTITLGMLTTHTSGLPRLPDGTINLLKLLNLSDPYVNYSMDNLWEDLADSKRNKTGNFEYSNFAVAVLGHALAVCAYEKSWQDLIAHRVTDVLGLHDVRLESPTPVIQGHSRRGTPVSEWHFPKMGMAPAGAFRANIMALSILVQKMISNDDYPGKEIIRTSIQPLYRFASENERAFSAVGMNWFLGIGRFNEYLSNPNVKEIMNTLVWHAGQTGGHGAIVAALPEKQLGIAILSDTSSEFSTMVAILGLSQLLGESRDHLQKVSDRVFTADKIVLAKPD